MDQTQKKTQLIGFSLWLLVTFVAAATGSIASITAATFYGSLVQPDWAPPAGVFAPVWTALFAMMGVAAWLAWRKAGFGLGLNLYLVQLGVNALWSWLFFGWHLGGWALLDLLALWALIVATLIAFWRVSPFAGALLLPYLAWVTFAGFLNYTVWQLNPQVLG